MKKDQEKAFEDQRVLLKKGFDRLYRQLDTKMGSLPPFQPPPPLPILGDAENMHPVKARQLNDGRRQDDYRQTTADRKTDAMTSDDKTTGDRVTADKTTPDRTTGDRVTVDKTTLDRTTGDRTTEDKTTVVTDS